MLVKTRQPLIPGGCLVVFLLLIICRGAFGQPYDLPIRVIARADTHRLYYNYYSIRECLDIYNDDNLRPLIITGVTASTWRGHKKDVMDDDWFTGRRPVTIKPGTVYRVVERKRVVIGMFKRDWWVRWIKFKVTTSRGDFESNLVASRFKKTGELGKEIHQPKIDTLSEPQGLTPVQKRLPA
ncbi:MAG TPA: hypothetical protein PKC25_17170, partial [Candidatus Rifleibacterium sp.]|nr:hypothetical protein [Candidatus Rifleibacterium sp.]